LYRVGTRAVCTVWKLLYAVFFWYSLFSWRWA